MLMAELYVMVLRLRAASISRREFKAFPCPLLACTDPLLRLYVMVLRLTPAIHLASVLILTPFPHVLMAE